LLKDFSDYHKEKFVENKEPDYKNFLIETTKNKRSKKIKEDS